MSFFFQCILDQKILHCGGPWICHTCCQLHRIVRSREDRRTASSSQQMFLFSGDVWSCRTNHNALLKLWKNTLSLLTQYQCHEPTILQIRCLTFLLTSSREWKGAVRDGDTLEFRIDCSKSVNTVIHQLILRAVLFHGVSLQKCQLRIKLRSLTSE